MPIKTTYTNARAHFAHLCDTATSTREPVIIQRRGAEDVALVSAAELSSITETAHLLRSPKNAQRLHKALERARKGGGRVSSPKALAREVGLKQE